MMTRCSLAGGFLGFTLCTQLLSGQSAPHYRNFRLGGDLASVSALAGVAVSEAKVIHERPAVMQDLEWRLPYSGSSAAALLIDPVHQIVFSFYNDQLFRLVIDYDRNRTEGMTDADMIEAISSAYGSPSKVPPKSPATSSQLTQESGTRLARWGDADYSVVLYRSSYASGFRMVVTSVRLEVLARTADAEAIRLDQRDAPRREIARQKKEAEAMRAAQEKARLANKAAFRP
jgi:hypothetical protein